MNQLDTRDLRGPRVLPSVLRRLLDQLDSLRQTRELILFQLECQIKNLINKLPSAAERRGKNSVELGKKGDGRRTPVVSPVRGGAVRQRSRREASRCLFLADFLEEKKSGGGRNIEG